MIGSVFYEETLDMAQMYPGCKVFILCDQFETSTEQTDTFALLASKAIHDYDSTIKVYVQLI